MLLCGQALAHALGAAQPGCSWPGMNGSVPAPAGTLLIAPEECNMHHTCVLPMERGGREAPPENVDRLHVLTGPGESAVLLTRFKPCNWVTPSTTSPSFHHPHLCHKARTLKVHVQGLWWAREPPGLLHTGSHRSSAHMCVQSWGF